MNKYEMEREVDIARDYYLDYDHYMDDYIKPIDDAYENERLPLSSIERDEFDEVNIQAINEALKKLKNLWG